MILSLPESSKGCRCRHNKYKMHPNACGGGDSGGSCGGGVCGGWDDGEFSGS